MRVLFMRAIDDSQLGIKYDEIDNILFIYDRTFDDNNISKLKHQQLIKLIGNYYSSSVLKYKQDQSITIRLPRIHSDFITESEAQADFLKVFGKNNILFV